MRMGGGEADGRMGGWADGQMPCRRERDRRTSGWTEKGARGSDRMDEWWTWQTGHGLGFTGGWADEGMGQGV